MYKTRSDDIIVRPQVASTSLRILGNLCMAVLSFSAPAFPRPVRQAPTKMHNAFLTGWTVPDLDSTLICVWSENFAGCDLSLSLRRQEDA
jgi:hypothetical protein